MNMETISVIGLGYIGLPTAAIIASRKKKVIGVDINKMAVDTINKGEIHIIEPELDIVVRSAVSQGYLKASTIPEPADAFVIAVPTPFKVNHEPDLSYIEAASKSIAPLLQKGNLVILESTSPVGATEQMTEWLAAARPDLTFPHTHGSSSDIRIAYCPERVLPGHVIRELVENDRIVGGMSEECSRKACELYKIFVQGECTITNSRTAEMAKLTENSFRDVNIAFANELSLICDAQKINVWELISLANKHPRVKILQPGPGVGGHCIAVDPWFIVSQNPNESKLIKISREVNDHKPHWVVKKIQNAIEQLKLLKHANDISISFYGLSFKANIDDLRESPALEICQIITSSVGCKILVVEPNIRQIPNSLENAVLSNVESALNSDIHVLLVDHNEFKSVTPKAGVIIDTRGIWSS